ncbi:MAG: hypothetical protein HC772_19570 [Leptolyngbyaceae cyanobacterium CRU_2_3]|nr:hypothetical protein [Leptolyngbyaceae cyanobacterium CRU_2_3]
MAGSKRLSGEEGRSVGLNNLPLQMAVRLTFRLLLCNGFLWSGLTGAIALSAETRRRHTRG